MVLKESARRVWTALKRTILFSLSSHKTETVLSTMQFATALTYFPLALTIS
jgi:hypothetical protein